jgi:uncharacterized protein
MNREKDLKKLLKTLNPIHNAGEYVFCKVQDIKTINPDNLLYLFREKEGITLVLRKEIADGLNLEYTHIASWITLSVHSSLEAVGLTAAFSTTLAKEGISCNIVAAYYHDHIFVDKKDTENALQILKRLSNGN